MTENDWLNATQPQEMLLFLQNSGMASERKLRLFAMACCRQVWHIFRDRRSQKGIEVGELYADGLVSREAFEDARRAARIPWWDSFDAYQDAIQAAHATARWERKPSAAAVAENERRQCDLARDIFNPFRPVLAIAEGVLAWNDGLIKQLASAAYELRSMPGGHLDNERLAVLSDALEEAGADGALIEHLRSPGPHVRGCYALDLLTGRV